VLDLSLQMLEPEVLAGADLVAIYVAMHTATRIAVAALRASNNSPRTHTVCYACMRNERGNVARAGRRHGTWR